MLSALLLAFSGPAMAERIGADRIHVVDGDTIDVDEDRYRLVGFDTPETYFAKCDYERALGNAATDRLEDLIRQNGGVEMIVLPGRDRYRRGLARLKFQGRDIGSILISEGLARAYEGGRRKPWC